MKEMTEYDVQAHNFLAKTKSSLEITKEGTYKGFPNTDDNLERYYYTIKLRKGRKTYTTKFYDSYHNFMNNERPSKYSILASLITFDPGDFHEFCSEYGYNNDSISALNIYKEVKKQYKKLSELYTPEEMKMLGEIQ